MRLTRVLLALTVGFVASAEVAWACTCPPNGPPCQSAFEVDAVFVGTVRSISPLPENDLPTLRPGEFRIPRSVRVEFDNVVAFRGKVTPPSVSVLTAGTGPECGYGFKQGERYLVYASRRENGLVTGLCSRTRPLAKAEEDLQFLQSLSTPVERARLYGTVTHWEHDMAADRSQNHGTVANVRISISGAGTFVEASTDDKGRFDVRVPPGKYNVAVQPPPGFTTRDLAHSIELSDAHACAVLDWSVKFDGRIRGVVERPREESNADVSMELMTVESIGKVGHVAVLRAAVDRTGRFEFTGVPPGRYVIGVDLLRRNDAKVVFPATFHPGTQDAASATIVELRGGQQRELAPMTLPAPRRTQQLAGSVVFEDGSAAPGAFIALYDGRDRLRQVAAGRKTGPDGTFSVLVHEGLTYLVHAWFRDDAADKYFNGFVGPVLVGAEMPPLRVVLIPQR